jgi:hypothetical protein
MTIPTIGPSGTRRPRRRATAALGEQDTTATVTPVRSPLARPQAVARWGGFLGEDGALSLVDKPLSPPRFDPAKLTEDERAAGWGERLAEHAEQLAMAHASGAAPRALHDLAWRGARVVSCDECGAKAHRAQCAPREGYHLKRFIRAAGLGLITLEELIAVITAVLRLQGRDRSHLIRVSSLTSLAALEQARHTAEATDSDAAWPYALAITKIRNTCQPKPRRLHAVD